MPGSIIHGLLQVFLEAVFETTCYYAGRVVVPIISIGRWNCDRMTTTVPRRKLRAAGFYHLRGDRVFVTAEATQLVGLASIILGISCVVLIAYLERQ